MERMYPTPQAQIHLVRQILADINDPRAVSLEHATQFYNAFAGNPAYGLQPVSGVFGNRATAKSALADLDRRLLELFPEELT